MTRGSELSCLDAIILVMAIIRVHIRAFMQDLGRGPEGGQETDLSILLLLLLPARTSAGLSLLALCLTSIHSGQESWEDLSCGKGRKMVVGEVGPGSIFAPNCVLPCLHTLEGHRV
jgi:hypothetical protein